MISIQPSSGSRLRGIEGLRAIAACCVLLLHSWSISSPSGKPVSLGSLTQRIPDLAFGVTLFFALSGFLLYRPFATAILRAEALPSVTAYLRNRALRILPAYWVILVTAAVFLQTVLVRHGDSLSPGRLLGLNLVRTGAFTQNYTPSTLGMGIGPAWSLAIEAIFYLTLPALVLLAIVLARACTSRSGRALATLAPCLLMLGLGLAGKAAAIYLIPGPYGEWGQTWHSVLELSFLCQADLFAFGMIVAVLHAEARDGRLKMPRRWRQAAAATAILLYVVAAARITSGEQQLSASPINTLMAAACGLLLAIVVLPPVLGERPPILLRLLETRALVYVGTISYSVFLWHGPLIRWLKLHGLTWGGQLGLVGNTLVLLGLTLVLSTVTYRFVEAPALRLKARRGRDEMPAAQAAAAP